MMQVNEKILCLAVALLCGATAAQSAGLVKIAPAANGIVAVDNPSPEPGDVVTITVTPDPDYKIAKADITAEAIVDPDVAQAPALGTPPVGYFLTLEGDEPINTTVEASYTFVMPESPLNVLVTARFKEKQHTTVHDPAAQPAVVSVSYVDLAGRVSVTPHPGLNLVVTTLADGSRTVTRQAR